MSKLQEDFISKCVLEFNNKQEDLTKEQFQDCLLEAIISGDFVRACTELKGGYYESPRNVPGLKGVMNISSSQSMTYIPYRRVGELEKQLDEMKVLLIEACAIIEDSWFKDHVFLNKPEIKKILI